jgi:hypothetical protein
LWTDRQARKFLALRSTLVLCRQDVDGAVSERAVGFEFDRNRSRERAVGVGACGTTRESGEQISGDPDTRALPGSASKNTPLFPGGGEGQGREGGLL